MTMINLALDDIEAAWVREALIAEAVRLRDLQIEARDRADRRQWAVLGMKHRCLYDAAGSIDFWLEQHAAPSRQSLTHLEQTIARRALRMPRSKANAALLATTREVGLAQSSNGR